MNALRQTGSLSDWLGADKISQAGVSAHPFLREANHIVMAQQGRNPMTFWLQRSQMFMDLAANHYWALQRSAMYWWMNTSNFTFHSVGAKKLIDGRIL